VIGHQRNYLIFKTFLFLPIACFDPILGHV
jgi:hypothetical protein